MKRSRVGVLLLPEFSLICCAAAYEPFRKAKEIFGQDLLDISLLSLQGTSVVDCEGRKLEVDQELDQLTDVYDALIVVASFNAMSYWSSKLSDFLRWQYNSGCLVAAADVGTWLLAKAGLLSRRRATIHWEDSEVFSAAYPEIELVEEGYVFDGRLLTCSGGTAMLPAAIETIEKLWGWPLAVEVAHMFNITSRTTRYVQQQNAYFQQMSKRSPALATAVRLIRSHIQKPLTINGLAKQCGVSQRTLNSVFHEHIGSSPQDFYLRERLLIAQRLITGSEKSMIDIAFTCGFSSSQSFSRAYRLKFGKTASEERKAVVSS